VHSWLCEESNRQWLIVVDNADDDQVFASASSSDYLDNAAQGAEPVQEAVALLVSFLPQAASG
jgi:hypothetical protein